MFLKRLLQSKAEIAPQEEKPNEFQQIQKLQEISNGLGEYAKAYGDPYKGAEMLSVIQVIEGQSADSQNASLFCALAIAYRNYCAWFVRGNDRQLHLEKVVSCFERALALDPDYVSAKSELAYTLIEEKQVRNLEKGVALLEELKLSGNLSETMAISLQKAQRQMGQAKRTPTISNFARLSVYLGALAEQRKTYRALIRQYKKSGQAKELKKALDTLYNLAVFVAAIYGDHDCNSGVNGHNYDIACIMKRKIGHLIQFNYSQDGRITEGQFLSESDYKQFLQVYGDTDNSINPREIFKNEYDEAIREEKEKFEKELAKIHASLR
jgi:tetratricopeptide (TPR) repeat protein